MKNANFEGKKMFEESSAILRVMYDGLSAVILSSILYNYIAFSTPIIGVLY